MFRYSHRREAATAAKGPDNHVSSPNLESSNHLNAAIQPDTSLELSLQCRIFPPTPVAKPHLSSDPAQRSKDTSPPKFDHAKFDQWLTENPQFTSGDLRSTGTSLDEHRRYGLDPPKSPMSADQLGLDQPPEPPLKGLRRSLTTKVKRFSSISRAASLSSKSTNRSSQETHRSSRTPSPLSHYPARTSPLISHNKVISINPSALYCHEVGGQTTALQRCYIYANKINELSMYDCGLSNWVGQMKDQSWPLISFYHYILINNILLCSLTFKTTAWTIVEAVCPSTTTYIPVIRHIRSNISTTAGRNHCDRSQPRAI